MDLSSLMPSAIRAPSLAFRSFAIRFAFLSSASDYPGLKRACLGGQKAIHGPIVSYINFLVALSALPHARVLRMLDSCLGTVYCAYVLSGLGTIYEGQWDPHLVAAALSPPYCRYGCKIGQIVEGANLDDRWHNVAIEAQINSA